jgi:hypothetical protein
LSFCPAAKLRWSYVPFELELSPCPLDWGRAREQCQLRSVSHHSEQDTHRINVWLWAPSHVLYKWLRPCREAASWAATQHSRSYYATRKFAYVLSYTLELCRVSSLWRERERERGKEIEARQWEALHLWRMNISPSGSESSKAVPATAPAPGTGAIQ